MKLSSFLFIFLILSSISKAQNNLSDAFTTDQDGKYNRKAYYNLGEAYFQKKDYDSSNLILKSFLATTFTEKQMQEESYIPDIYYKGLACDLVYKIHLERKQYDSAFYYLELDYREYNYSGGCGYGQSSLQWDRKKAEVYIAMGDYPHAKKLLYNTLFRMDEISPEESVEMLKAVYITEGHTKKLKKDLDKAIRRINFRENSDNDERKEFFFNFQKIEIHLDTARCLDSNIKKCQNEYREIIRNSSFYKMVKDLAEGNN